MDFLFSSISFYNEGKFKNQPRRWCKAIMLNSKKLAVVVLVLLIVGTGYFVMNYLNLGSSRINSDAHLSIATVNEKGNENWQKVGLQLAYSTGEGEFAREFMEKAAALLQEKGVGEVVLLPTYFDLEMSNKDLEGVFLFNFDLEDTGWQLSRSGLVKVTAEFIPLKESSLFSMSTGVISEGVSRGWLNRFHFTESLLEHTGEKWVEQAGNGLLLAPLSSRNEVDIRWLEANIEELPSPLGKLVAGDGEVRSFFSRGDHFALTYITEQTNLEDFLARHFKHEWGLEVLQTWQNAAGGRRMMSFISKDYNMKLEASYSDTNELPYVDRKGGPPHRQQTRDDARENMVIITTRFK